MKHTILFTSIWIFFAFHAEAQNSNYKVVFDMTSKDTVNQQALIRELNIISQTSPAAKLEVVTYGEGLNLVVKDRTSQQDAVAQLIKENRASFKVCAFSLKRNNVDKSQLIPGVEVVPDGIYEIISKQREGWGYIKVGH